MTQFPKLLPWGWSDRFEALYLAQAGENPGWLPARVLREEKGRYEVVLPNDEKIWAQVTGKLLHGSGSREDLPAVGDWVLGEGTVIHAVLPRSSVLKRRAAGSDREIQLMAVNVDYVLVASSLNADHSPNRIDRYLTMIWDSGAKPVIVLTKADLVAPAEVERLRDELQARVLGTPIHVLSSTTGVGLEGLAPYFAEGQTAVIVGSSGVGKSTLLNGLSGSRVALTQEVRWEDAKGRHTTTARSLYRLPSGGLLIDTPGIRELQLLDYGEGIGKSFPDVEAILARCRFSNCGHASEPGCAVKAAHASGELSSERWESYLKIQREVHHMERKTNKVVASEEKKKWKKIHKNLKDRNRSEGR